LAISFQFSLPTVRKDGHFFAISEIGIDCHHFLSGSVMPPMANWKQNQPEITIFPAVFKMRM